MAETLNIGFLLFPRLTQLDLTGPYEVFSRLPGARVRLLWKTPEPVRADTGLGLLPDTTLADCPPLDLVCVPGGPGVAALMEDASSLRGLSSVMINTSARCAAASPMSGRLARSRSPGTSGRRSQPW